MELEKQKNLWKKISQSRNGNSPESSNVTMQKTAAFRTQNRNANNSNNNEPGEESTPPRRIQRSESNEDFGDIHPQTTPEGYGLKTPYGTHFDLDFLKYCQNIAESQTYQVSPRTPRSRSNSQRSSIISCDSRSDVSGSDRDLSSLDSRPDAERNLLETRRRLDAFRSFRKKTPSIKEQQQYSSRFTRSVISNGQREKVLETDPCASPVLTTLLNGPIQQQNLQAVREQMAGALARLKYLENEVKQIQVLEVKISVLQQEKLKLYSELKMYREASQAKDQLRKNSPSGWTSSQSESPVSTPSLPASPLHSPRGAVPPPPPRRKYKSVAVGPNSTESEIQEQALKKLSRVLSRSELKITSIDPSPVTEIKDACIGTTTRTLSKQTSTEQTQLCNSSTSSSDLVKTVTIASGDHIHMHDAESQYSKSQCTDFQIQVEKTDFNSDACNQVGPTFTDKAVSTDNNIVITSPKVMKDSCIRTTGFVPLKRSVSTSTLQVETVDKGENTCTTVFEDKALMCKPGVSDFECHVHIRPRVTSSFAETDPAPAKCDANTSTYIAMVDKAGNTKSTVLIDKASSCKPDVAEFDCSVNICPAVMSVQTETVQIATMDSCTDTDHLVPHLTDRASNTDIIHKLDKSFLFRPDVSDFSSNVHLRHGVSVSTCTNNAGLTDSQTNTEVISCQSYAAQISPTTSDFSNIARIMPTQSDAAVSVDIPLEIPKIPSNEISAQTDLDVLKDWYESIVREKKSVQDASTEMVSDPQEIAIESIQSEIGEYVGQVKSLLEEQQNLLAGEYKELGDVLDEESNVPKATNDAEKFQDPPNLPQQLIEDLNAFSKDKYELPSELKAACETIAKTKTSEVDALTVNDALELLKEEWFLISALQDPRPDYIKDFASEVRALSPYALTKVANSLDSTGNSALHYAVSHEDFGLIYTLADIPELDVDQHNNAGYTASMLAAITKIKTEFEVRAIAALFQRADVSLHAKQAGQTALMLAVSHGCAPAAKLLLKAGADVNAQDEDGSTALMCATEHGHIELVKLLLAQPDCDPTLTDNDGSAAINIAMDSGQRDIGVLLYVHRKLDKSQEY